MRGRSGRVRLLRPGCVRPTGARAARARRTPVRGVGRRSRPPPKRPWRYASVARPWCRGNTTAFQAVVTSSSLVGRFPAKPGPSRLRAMRRSRSSGSSSMSRTHTLTDIEGFWLDRLGLSRAALTKTQVNVYSKYSQKKRNGKLPYGTAKFSVHSTRIVQTIYGSIQEYGGFDRPEWLG